MTCFLGIFMSNLPNKKCLFAGNLHNVYLRFPQRFIKLNKHTKCAFISVNQEKKPRHETNYICNTHKLLMNNNNRALAQNLLSVYKYYFWTLIPQNTLEVMKMEIYSVAIFSSINKTFYYTQTKCFRENLLGKKIFFLKILLKF